MQRNFYRPNVQYRRPVRTSLMGSFRNNYNPEYSAQVTNIGSLRPFERTVGPETPKFIYNLPIPSQWLNVAVR